MTKRLDDKLNSLFSRRSFLAGAGTVAATALVAGCSDSSTTTIPVGPTAATFTDADILNYALNLEYLEASFYLYAANGKGLATADLGASPGAITTSGNIAVTSVAAGSTTTPITTAQQNIINEIAYEEQQHVRYLRAALTTSAVSCPALDLTFFSSLAVAAGITTSATGSGAFSPYTSFDAFLIGSFIFEDVGVTAYSGGATLITSAANLLAAAGVLAVEAYHAAYVRTAITARALANGTSTYINIANQVAALRATLTVGNNAAPSTSGSVETKLTLPASPTSASSIVAADPTNAIGFYRTTSQVHHIVYGTPTIGATKGGFFPAGTNSIFSVAN